MCNIQWTIFKIKTEYKWTSNCSYKALLHPDKAHMSNWKLTTQAKYIPASIHILPTFIQIKDEKFKTEAFQHALQLCKGFNRIYAKILPWTTCSLSNAPFKNFFLGVFCWSMFLRKHVATYIMFERVIDKIVFMYKIHVRIMIRSIT